jgi:hypothetical protein
VWYGVVISDTYNLSKPVNVSLCGMLCLSLTHETYLNLNVCLYARQEETDEENETKEGGSTVRAARYHAYE